MKLHLLYLVPGSKVIYRNSMRNFVGNLWLAENGLVDSSNSIRPINDISPSYLKKREPKTITLLYGIYLGRNLLSYIQLQK